MKKLKLLAFSVAMVGIGFIGISYFGSSEAGAQTKPTKQCQYTTQTGCTTPQSTNTCPCEVQGGGSQ